MEVSTIQFRSDQFLKLKMNYNGLYEDIQTSEINARQNNAKKLDIASFSCQAFNKITTVTQVDFKNKSLS